VAIETRDHRASAHQTPDVRQEERYVSPSWLAEYWDVHVHTIYRDIRKRALRATRMPGGRFRIRWIDARRYGRPLE
jgi:excisionase family DNA binding protein